MTEEEILAYCVKEKARKPMKDPEIITLKNGKRALRGTCASCGTKMVRLIPKSDKRVGGSSVETRPGRFSKILPGFYFTQSFRS